LVRLHIVPPTFTSIAVRLSPGRSLTVRLVLAFLAVSLLPIGVLAYLSATESESGVREAGEAHGGEQMFLGVPTATVELAVAAVSFVLSLAIAVYVARTILRPVRQLEGAMRRVERGDLEATAAVTSADELGRLAAGFNQMLEGLRRERLIRGLFGLYVSPEVARSAIEQQGALEPQLADASVVFADIRDFTALAETVPAAELLALLNRYFDRMADVIVEEGGLVNKFGGDSMLAVFGTPLNRDEEHPQAAIRAAVRMTHALEQFNDEQAASGSPALAIGIGIATGEVVAGNVGSTRRLEYTVIGDTVNLAARLQALTKDFGEAILASGETAARAGDAAGFRACGQVTVRGKASRVAVVAVEPGGAAGT